MPRIGGIYETERGAAVFLGIGKDGARVYREVATAEQFAEEGPTAAPEDAPEDVEICHRPSDATQEQASDQDPDGFAYEAEDESAEEE